jgi:hypothetical protein
MREDITSIEGNSGDYMHDLKLLKAYGGEGFVGIPTILNPSSGNIRNAHIIIIYSQLIIYYW